jgi:hypothetical protein
MNRYLVIALSLFLIILVILLSVGVILFVSQKNLKIEEKIDENQEKTAVYEPIVIKNGNKVIVYDVEVKSKCFTQYQKFEEEYGADYSKCLNRFYFDQESCSGFDADTEIMSDFNVIVIFDASGSMAAKIGQRTKIDIAKSAVSDFLNKIPKGVNTGSVVYGHKGSNSITDKEMSCNGIEEIIKIGKNNVENILNAMKSFEPRGWTPLAGSISYTKDIFLGMGENDKNYLILLSDGIESCDGDPFSAVRNLKSELPDIELIIVGFTSDSAIINNLKRVSAEGKGSYLTAQNASDMTSAFDKQISLIKKDCLKTALLRMAFEIKDNDFKNLECWLEEYKKETNYFEEKLTKRFFTRDCYLEVADILKAKHTDFWNKKESQKQEDVSFFNKIKESTTGQLKELESLKK